MNEIKETQYEAPEFEEIKYLKDDILTNTSESQDPTSEWDDRIIRD